MKRLGIIAKTIEDAQALANAVGLLGDVDTRTDPDEQAQEITDAWRRAGIVFVNGPSDVVKEQTIIVHPNGPLNDNYERSIESSRKQRCSVFQLRELTKTTL